MFIQDPLKLCYKLYNTSFVYCRELAPGTVSLTGEGVRDDDSKQN